MKITKLGHCCLLIKEKALTILTDPGLFTTTQNEVKGIDVVLITHEHQDHIHMESLKKILENNPEANVITNTSVGTLLDAEHISYTVVADKQEIVIDGVLIQGLGTVHDEVYKEVPRVENTGYFINKRLFYPGDALYNPEQPIDILALPIVGPWTKTSDVIDYARAVKPKKAFPVHDGMLNQFGMFYSKMVERFMPQSGIDYMTLEIGVETDL